MTALEPSSTTDRSIVDKTSHSLVHKARIDAAATQFNDIWWRRLSGINSLMSEGDSAEQMRKPRVIRIMCDKIYASAWQQVAQKQHKESTWQVAKVTILMRARQKRDTRL
jgi:hypothetical protein